MGLLQFGKELLGQQVLGNLVKYTYYDNESINDHRFYST